MLDALRQHKPPSPDPDAPPRRGASDDSVLASLGYPSVHAGRSGRISSHERLGFAIVLVLVTGMLLWQVAATNRLLPSGPFSRVFGAGSAAMSPTPLLNDAGPGPLPPSAAAPAASAPTVDASTSRPPALSEPTPVQAPGAAGFATPESKPSGGLAMAAAQIPVTVRQASRVPPAAPALPHATGSASAAPGGAASPPVSRAPAGEVDHFKLALYYQRIGDFENALVHYRALLVANELNAEAHNNLGLLYQEKGLYEEAIREFQRATFIEPRYGKAHNNLGVALLRSGKTDASVSEFRGIVAQEPNNIEALTNLSLALKAAGRAEEARETLQRALGISGRYAPAHYNLALLYEERGELQRAIDHYEQFVTMAGPDNATLSVEVRTRVQALRAKLR